MKKVRCKFQCHSISESLGSVYNPDTGKYESGKVYTPKFSVVHSGSEDDKKFHAATPSGTLEFGMLQVPFFEVGKKYYIDISLADD